MTTESNGLGRAMDAVNSRVNDFEHSLDNIIGKIEGVSETFQRLLGIGARQTQRIGAVKDRTLEAVGPVLRGGQRLGGRVVTQVRENPRTVLFGAALIVGGLWLITRQRSAGVIEHGGTVNDDRDERFMH